MAGHRSLRQRRASLRPFAAAQIAELLESRRLLAAVIDDEMVEESAVCEEVPVEVVADEELLCEPIAGEPLTEEVVDEVIGDEVIGDEAVTDAVAFNMDGGDEEFTPILVVCEFPEELWTRYPVDFDPNAGDAGEWDWSTDYTTVRGIDGDAEYVTFDGSEGFEITDSMPIEKGGRDEATWTDFVDAETDVTGELPFDATFSSDFQPEDPKLWSRDNFLPAGDDSEPQLMLFSEPVEGSAGSVLFADNEFASVSSFRGGFGVVLRTLALSVPAESVQLSAQLLPSSFVPEQRQMDSIFAGQWGAAGLSGDRAADSRLITVRPESRAAAPAVATSVVPKRSSLLTGSQSDSAIEEEAVAVEGGDELDVFGAEGASGDKKASRSRQSQSEPREEIPVSESDSAAAVSRTARESSESDQSLVVAVPAESATVSGLNTRKPVTR